MSDKLEKVKYLCSTLSAFEMIELIDFATKWKKDSWEENQKEKKQLETKAYSIGPVSVTDSSGKCALCGK